MTGLRDDLASGLTERELGDLVERADPADGGASVIRHFGVTPMRDPQLGASSDPSGEIVWELQGSPV